MGICCSEDFYTFKLVEKYKLGNVCKRFCLTLKQGDHKNATVKDNKEHDIKLRETIKVFYSEITLINHCICANPEQVQIKPKTS